MVVARDVGIGDKVIAGDVWNSIPAGTHGVVAEVFDDGSISANFVVEGKKTANWFYEIGEYEIADNETVSTSPDVKVQSDLKELVIDYVDKSDTFDEVEESRNIAMNKLLDTFCEEEFPLVFKMPNGKWKMITSYDTAYVSSVTVIE